MHGSSSPEKRAAIIYNLLTEASFKYIYQLNSGPHGITFRFFFDVKLLCYAFWNLCSNTHFCRVPVNPTPASGLGGRNLHAMKAAAIKRAEIAVIAAAETQYISHISIT